MSKEIDSRVVEMKFDNKQFESGVKTSISTLDRLKQSLKLDDAAKGFDNINSAAKTVNLSGISRAAEEVRVRFSAMQVVATTALANITNSAIETGKRMIDSLKDPLIEGGKTRSQNIEQAKFQLEGLGVAWDTIVNDINYGVKDTAYGLDAAAKVASQLVASNIKVGDSMKTALRGVSGVAAMTNSSYEDIGRIFTTVAGQGRLMADQLNQLSSRGINAAATLAKHLGITEAEVRDMTSKGKIDFAMFAEAMDNAFGEHAKDANKTFSGALSNMKAALSRIGADVATPAYQDLRDIFNTLTPIFNKVHTALGPLISDIEKVMKTVTDLTINKLNIFSDSVLSSGFDKFKSQISSTGIAFEDFQNALVETAKSHGIAIDDMIQKEGLFENTLKNGWLTSGIVSESLNKFTDSVNQTSRELVDFEDIVYRVINGDFGNGATRVNKLTEAGWDYATVQGLVNDVLKGNKVEFEKMSDAQLANMGYTDEQIQLMRQLAEEANKTGTPINELIDSLEKPSVASLLVDSIRNAFSGLQKILIAVRNAWIEVFSPSNSNLLYSIANGIHNFTSKMVISDDTADKLKRTLKGLFSALDLIRNIATGALKTAFTVISSVLSVFDMDIIGVTAAIGDAITNFREWYKEHDVLSKALEKLSSVVKKTTTFIKDFVKKFKDIPQVQQTMEKLKDVFDKVAEKIKKFVDDAVKKITEFIEKVKSMDSINLDDIKVVFKGFKNNISDFLKFDNIVKNVKSTFNSLKEKISKSLESTGSSFDGLKSKIRSFIDFIQQKFSNIGFGEIFTVGLGISLITSFKMVQKTLDMIKKPLGSLSDICDGVTGVLTEVQNVLTSYSTKIKSEALKNVAISIAILAASVVALTQIDQKKVWSSVGALVALAGSLIAITAIMGKLGKIEKFSVNMVALAGGILLLAFTLKTLETLDPDKTVSNLIILITMMLGLSTAVGVLSKYAPNLSKGAMTILAFAVAVGILGEALRRIDEIDVSIKSITVLIGIMGALVGLMAATKLASRQAAKVGVGILAISASILLMVKVLNKLNDVDVSLKTIGNLIVIMGALTGLMAATSLAGKNAAKAGAGMLGIATSLFIMISVLKKIDSLTIKGKSIATLLGIVGILAVLMASTRLAGENAAKAGAGMLMISVAIGILAGVIVLLSKIDPSGLGRAVAAISVLGGIFAGLIAVTKLATDCKATLITLTVTIGILTVALGALSMINPEGLKMATIALSSVIGMFALLVASTNLAKSAYGTIIAMTAVVTALALMLTALAELNPESVLASATGLSMLMMSLSVSLLLIRKVGAESMQGIGALAVMGLVVAELGTILGVLAYFNVEPSIETATALSILLLAMSGALLILTAVGSAGPGAFIGIGALATLIAGIGALMIGIGALMEYVPSMQEFLDTGIVVLEKIGYGLGSFLGNIVGGFLGGASSGLGEIGTNLSTFISNAKPFFDGMSNLDDSVLSGVKNLAETMLILATANFVDGLASALTGTSSMTAFGEQIVPFGQAIKEYGDIVAGINVSGVQDSVTAGKALAELASIIPNSGGVAGFFAGENNIDDFGTRIVPFGQAIKEYGDTVAGINVSGVQDSVTAGKAIAELASVLPNSGGVAGFFAGENNIDDFGTRIVPFGKAIKEYGDTVADINISGVQSSVTAGKAIAELASVLPNSGGVAGFFAGGNNIDDFGTRIVPFGKAIKEYGDTVADINISGVQSSVTAGRALAELASIIPNSGGVAGFFAGGNNIDDFGTRIIEFGKAIKKYGDTVSDIDTSGIQSSVTAGKAIANILSSLANSSSFAGFLSGGINVNDFGTRIIEFGKAIKKYGDTVSGIDTSGVQSSINAGKSFQQLMNSIPDESVDVVGFGNTMVEFGKKLSEFSSVTSVNINGIQAAINVANSFGQLANSIPNQGNDIVTFGSNMVEFGKKLSEFSSITSNINLSNVTSNISGFVSSLGSIGTAGIDGFINSFASAGSRIAQAVYSIMSVSATSLYGNISMFQNAGLSLGNAIAIGLQAASSVVIAACVTVASSGASGAGTQTAGFYVAGSNSAAGLALGILSGRSAVIAAAISLATSALQAAKNALDINSPSVVMKDEVGRYVAEGIAEGITSDMSAEEAAEKKAQNIVNAFNKEFDKLDISSKTSELEYQLWELLDDGKSSISERTNKKVESIWQQIGNQEQKVRFAESEFQQMVETFGESSEYAIEAKNTLLESMIELEELNNSVAETIEQGNADQYEHSMNWIEQEKAYNRLSLEEELAAYERVQSQYEKGTEERKKADEKVYSLRHELIDDSLTLLDAEIARQKELLSTLQEGTLEYANTMKEIDYLMSKRKDAEYANSMNWIENEEFYDRLGPAAKLAAYTRVQQRYDVGTDERKEVDREIYKLQKEINESYEQYLKDKEDIQKESNEKRTELEQDYANKQKEINDQLEADIKELDDNYANSLESRTKTLYDTYGLFDEVAKKDKVSASTLIKNLQDQTAEFEDWNDSINQLSARGLNEALIEEIQEMGPSAIEEIKALNSMSDSQLAQYVNLWSTKHEEAKNRATDELEDLRTETDSKIQSLKETASEDLDALKSEFDTNLTELNDNTQKQLDELKTTFQKEVGIIGQYTDDEMTEMVSNAKNIMTEAGWNEVGEKIVDGMSLGIEAKKPTLMETITSLGTSMIGVVRTVLGIHSPSRVFAAIGRYMDEGLVKGLERYRYKVLYASSSIGEDAISSVSRTIGNIADVVDSDTEITPTIRPILDLNNITQGLNQVDGIITPDRSIQLGMDIAYKNQNGVNSAISDAISKLADENIRTNSMITESIDSLKDDFANLVDRVSRLQVVMDTGELVGVMSPEMDRSLGIVAKMKRRGSI